jgi:WD40 repeat protein
VSEHRDANDAAVKIWDSSSDSGACELLQSLEGHSGGVTSAAFSPFGGMLVSGGTDKSLKIWELRTTSDETKGGSFNDTIPSSEVGDLRASPDEDLLEDVENKERSWELAENIEDCHSGSVQCVAFNFDETLVISGSDDTTIKIWRTGKAAIYQ